MSLQQQRIRLFHFALLLTVGCATDPIPQASPTGTVVEVEITDTIPKIITVKERDMVRWVNKTNAPVHIFLTKPVDAGLSCSKGFLSTEGFEFVGSPNVEVTLGATVNSHEFASLCFSDFGIYNYTVRREQGMKFDGTVMVK